MVRVDAILRYLFTFVGEFKFFKMKKLLIVLVCAAGFVSCNQQKTAYVDTTRLMQDYQEMKDVEASFEGKTQRLRRELDSVGQDFQQQVQAYQVQAQNMSQSERQEAEGKLMELQQKLQQQQQTRSGQLREESGVIIDSLIEKVKVFVADYGKENNYTYIFGSNESANIMYAEEGLDITNEVLEKLNAAYKEE